MFRFTLKKWIDLGLVVFVALGVLFCIGVYRPSHGRSHTQGTYKAYTMNRLSQVFFFAELIEKINPEREKAPLTPKPFMDWGIKYLEDETFEKDLGFDSVNGRLLDYWNNPVRFIAIDGRLEALASAGVNGLWEDGQGDDIIVWREKVE